MRVTDKMMKAFDAAYQSAPEGSDAIRAGLEAALVAAEADKEKAVEELEAAAVKDGVVIHRYEYGGARIYIKRDRHMDLVMDLYDTEDAERREAIIAAALRAGAIRSRKGG